MARKDDSESTKTGLDRRSVLLALPAVGLLGGLWGCATSGSATDAGGRGDGATRADRGADGSPGDGRVFADRGADTTQADGFTADATGSCAPTESDALGPFHASGAPFREQLADAKEPGDRTMVEGVVYGPDCKTPLSDAIVDVWHADASGVYHDANTQYRLRGQIKTDSAGRYAFESIKPGNYDKRPAHYHFIVSRPGHQPLTTQIYFAGDPFLGPNDSCKPPTCDSGDPGRVVTFAPKTVGGKSLLSGSFDIVLRKA